MDGVCVCDRLYSGDFCQNKGLLTRELVSHSLFVHITLCLFDVDSWRYPVFKKTIPFINCLSNCNNIDTEGLFSTY